MGLRIGVWRDSNRSQGVAPLTKIWGTLRKLLNPCDQFCSSCSGKTANYGASNTKTTDQCPSSTTHIANFTLKWDYLLLGITGTAASPPSECTPSGNMLSFGLPLRVVRWTVLPKDCDCNRDGFEHTKLERGEGDDGKWQENGRIEKLFLISVISSVAGRGSRWNLSSGSWACGDQKTSGPAVLACIGLLGSRTMPLLTRTESFSEDETTLYGSRLDGARS
ncbi:hypothetical protein EDB19DRAFT_537586 [Suillus lakei]|nr:hypothetical protein EDB19DRAFT_537586 [Suillus lakei]